MGPIHMVFVFLGALLRRQARLAAENLALRQQLAVLEQRSKRPRLRKRDRIFWIWLSRLWAGWRSVLVIVQPDTVAHCFIPFAYPLTREAVDAARMLGVPVRRQVV